jgi:hypothetical protein
MYVPTLPKLTTFKIKVTFAGSTSFVDEDLKLSSPEYAYSFPSYPRAKAAKACIERKYSGNIQILEQSI